MTTLTPLRFALAVVAMIAATGLAAWLVLRIGEWITRRLDP